MTVISDHNSDHFPTYLNGDAYCRSLLFPSQQTTGVRPSPEQVLAPLSSSTLWWHVWMDGSPRSGYSSIRCWSVFFGVVVLKRQGQSRTGQHSTIGLPSVLLKDASSVALDSTSSRQISSLTWQNHVRCTCRGFPFPTMTNFDVKWSSNSAKLKFQRPNTKMGCTGVPSPPSGTHRLRHSFATNRISSHRIYCLCRFPFGPTCHNPPFITVIRKI